jgi:hypothetical protein
VGLGGSTVISLTLQQSKTVLVCLELGNDDLGGVDADWDGLSYAKKGLED